MDKTSIMESTADISPCGKYRYRLTRRWGAGVPSFYIGMANASTAGEVYNDQTIEACIRMAKREGLNALDVVNLFAFRSPYPSVIKKLDYWTAVGPRNDEVLQQFIADASRDCMPIVCAWGVNGTLHGRDKIVIEVLRGRGAWLMAPGITKAGHPRHPLYNNSPLVEFLS